MLFAWTPTDSFPPNADGEYYRAHSIAHRERKPTPGKLHYLPNDRWCKNLSECCRWRSCFCDCSCPVVVYLPCAWSADTSNGVHFLRWMYPSDSRATLTIPHATIARYSPVGNSSGWFIVLLLLLQLVGWRWRRGRRWRRHCSRG